MNTADLCDQYGADARVLTSDFRHYGTRSVFSGRAATVHCFEDSASIKALLEQPGQGRVMIIDGGSSHRCALFGDQSAQTAITNGWEGIVIAGCLRDAATINTLAFGIRALGASPRRSNRNDMGGHVDTVISIDGISIQPGDRIYADEDGIVVMPTDITPEGDDQ